MLREIEMPYHGGGAVFDDITTDDLIGAFFPCIYFCEASQSASTLSYNNCRKLSDTEKIEHILVCSGKRTEFFNLLVKLVGVCIRNRLRIVIENPWTMPHFFVCGIP